MVASLLATVSGVTMAPPAMAQEQSPAVNALIRQGEFWRGRGRKDLAQAAMQKALAAGPRNPDVFAALARFAAEDGDRSAADRWIAQLRAVAPADPRIAALTAVQRATPPAAGLAQARRLAQAGQSAEAVAAYRNLFGGEAPPEAYRLEYYQTLSGVEASWTEGREGLQKLAEAKPNDTAVKLAYAQALTYREPTRREGIAKLAALRATSAPTSGPAIRAWRQALLWLGAKPSDKPFYQSYLATNPNDAEVSAKLASIDAATKQQEIAAAASAAPAAPVDKGAPLRQDGFAALEHNDDAAAQAKFEAALKVRANDADALGGLGLVKLRAQDFAAARSLLQKAIDAAPASRARWQDALTSAKFFNDFRAAQAAGQAGDWARAETLIRPLAAQTGPDQAIARQFLADTLARQNRPAEAEALYRQILAAKPGQVDARTGLMEALIAQNRFAEAEQLSDTPADRTALSEARGRIELARANQAWMGGDVRGANAAFEQALAARPSDPWTRYDFARFLDEQGQSAAADGLIAPLPVAGAPPEALYVTALFAQRRNRSGDAFQLLSQIPTAQRTADMNRLMAELRVSAVIEQADAARKAGRNLEALATLRGIAGSPNLTVGAQSQIAGALFDLGDQAQALAMAQQALMQRDKGAPGAYGGYVSVLARAGRDAEADALIRQLAAQPSARSPDAQRAVADLYVGFSAERADRQRLSGDLAGAFDTLGQAFPASPNDPRLLGALARLYQSGGMADRAGAAYEQLLRLNPADQDALVGVTQAAIARNDWPRARQALAQAMARAPNDPDLYVLGANIEQGAGDKKAALRALQSAKNLRQRQYAYGSGAPAYEPAAPANAMGAGPLGPDPFASGGAMLPQRQAFSSRMGMGPTPAVFSGGDDQPRLQKAAWTTAIPDAPMPTATAPSLGFPPGAVSPYAPQPNYAPPAYAPQPYAPQPYAAPAPYAQPSAALYAQAPAYPQAGGYAPSPAPAYAPPAYATQPYAAAPYSPQAYAPQPPYAPPAPATQYAQTPSYPAPYAPTYAPNPPQTLAQGGPATINPFSNGPTRNDPLLAAIDERIASISTDTRPSLQAQIGFRGRSGEAGLSQLSDLNAQVSLDVSAFSPGKLMVTLKPVTLNAGQASGDSLQRIGSNPITVANNMVRPTETPTALHQPSSQSASGAGIDVAYTNGAIALDVEATPIGFTSIEAGGGLSWSPRVGKNGVAKVWVERRAVTDSLTSYAGSKDDLTGIRWGQVMRSTAGVSFSYDTGPAGLYTDVSDSDYNGTHTADNKSYQINVGAYIRPIQKVGEQLQVGVNLNHQGYDNNQNFFTLGQGGYFSPKSFTSVALPVEYKKNTGPWQLDLYAAPGYQTYVEEAAPYFPRDPGLQSSLEVLAKFNPAVTRTFAGSSQSGFGILAKGKFEYSFRRNLAVGSSVSYNSFGNYRETLGQLYIRQTLGGGA